MEQTSINFDTKIFKVTSLLREARLEKGLTITEVAQRIHTPRVRLSEIENGHIGLTLKRFFQICSVLGVSPTDIIAKADE